MLPLLAQLGIALVGAKLQRDEENKQRRFAIEQQLSDTKAAIEARRAARAGDSGYMQSAIGSLSGAPLPKKQAGRQMLTQMAGALMSQDAEPEATGGGGGVEATHEGPVFSSRDDTRGKWAGGNFNDDEERKWGNYA